MNPETVGLVALIVVGVLVLAAVGLTIARAVLDRRERRRAAAREMDAPLWEWSDKERR